MLVPDLDSAVARLQEMVEAARTIVPFTGAGISTECGIPDFRSPGGIWTKNRPIPFDELVEVTEASFAVLESIRAGRTMSPRVTEPSSTQEASFAAASTVNEN